MRIFDLLCELSFLSHRIAHKFEIISIEGTWVTIRKIDYDYHFISELEEIKFKT